MLRLTSINMFIHIVIVCTLLLGFTGLIIMILTFIIFLRPVSFLLHIEYLLSDKRYYINSEIQQKYLSESNRKFFQEKEDHLSQQIWINNFLISFFILLYSISFVWCLEFLDEIFNFLSNLLPVFLHYLRYLWFCCQISKLY